MTLPLSCDEGGVGYLRVDPKQPPESWSRYQLEMLVGNSSFMTMILYRFVGYGPGEYRKYRYGSDGCVSDQEAAGRAEGDNAI
jgi:hypothetical protein